MAAFLRLEAGNSCCAQPQNWNGLFDCQLKLQVLRVEHGESGVTELQARRLLLALQALSFLRPGAPNERFPPKKSTLKKQQTWGELQNPRYNSLDARKGGSTPIMTHLSGSLGLEGPTAQLAKPNNPGAPKPGQIGVPRAARALSSHSFFCALMESSSCKPVLRTWSTWTWPNGAWQAKPTARWLVSYTPMS